ncbi:MAG: hypothetical protein IIW02_01905 [Clostridia bacterium]|nr:hypothetical protein [Clostridia bacterium]
MKKISCLVLVFLFCLTFNSCYVDVEKNSLDDYILCVNRSKCGFSSASVDDPKRLLPSVSFLQDYEYINGEYFMHDDDPFKEGCVEEIFPTKSFICLKYSENIYYNAKEFMLEKIKPYNDKFYEYNNYIFYENSNPHSDNMFSKFPTKFMMACYNDENHTLIFIGFSYSPSYLDKKYLDDIEKNWISFIDTYYGELYDFSK